MLHHSPPKRNLPYPLRRLLTQLEFWVRRDTETEANESLLAGRISPDEYVDAISGPIWRSA